MKTEELLAILPPSQIEALLTLPLPRAGNPVRLQAARPFSSLWRKSAQHWDAMIQLERRGIVERRVSRGETLWRPTKGLGLQVRAHLQHNGEQAHHD